ncbi:MAG: hypothetical protein LBQ61_01815 [Spirochaetales bacterium]|jgi:hypothetical protein|nr:hypothetical protein [Spirochaetales bacterium]
MEIRKLFLPAGFCWDLLRFLFLLVLLGGELSVGMAQGNFLLPLLGVSGQPALSLLWARAFWAYPPGKGWGFLAACRFPGLAAELLGGALFLTRRLPGQGALVLTSSASLGAAGPLLFLLMGAGDLFFEIVLLFFGGERKAKLNPSLQGELP